VVLVLTVKQDERILVKNGDSEMWVSCSLRGPSAISNPNMQFHIYFDGAQDWQIVREEILTRGSAKDE